MATRLLLVAHAASTAARDLRFPHPDAGVHPTDLPLPISRPVRAAECGRGSSITQSAAALGVAPRVRDAWNERDYGTWSGRRLADVASENLGPWLAAPHEAPPSGESAERVMDRIEGRLAAGFPDGINLVVTSADVVRAAILLLTEAPVITFQALDVAALDALEITLNGKRHAIRSLRPYPDWL